VSAFKSATTDFKALRDRRKDLFGEPWHAETAVANRTKRERPRIDWAEIWRKGDRGDASGC